MSDSTRTDNIVNDSHQLLAIARRLRGLLEYSAEQDTFTVQSQWMSVHNIDPHELELIIRAVEFRAKMQLIGADD